MPGQRPFIGMRGSANGRPLATATSIRASTAPSVPAKCPSPPGTNELMPLRRLIASSGALTNEHK